MLESEEIEIDSISITFEKSLKIEPHVNSDGWTVEASKTPMVISNCVISSCLP